MKNFVMFVGAVFVAIAGAGSTAADPAAGLWQTGVDRGTVAYVRIAPCGEAMCEKIERSFNTEGEYQSPHIGKNILRNMVFGTSGEYVGRLWRPASGKQYYAKMTVSDASLTLHGCIAGGFILGSQAWARVGD